MDNQVHSQADKWPVVIGHIDRDPDETFPAWNHVDGLQLKIKWTGDIELTKTNHSTVDVEPGDAPSEKKQLALDRKMRAITAFNGLNRPTGSSHQAGARVPPQLHGLTPHLSLTEQFRRQLSLREERGLQFALLHDAAIVEQQSKVQRKVWSHQRRWARAHIAEFLEAPAEVQRRVLLRNRSIYFWIPREHQRVDLAMAVMSTMKAPESHRVFRAAFGFAVLNSTRLDLHTELMLLQAICGQSRLPRTDEEIATVAPNPARVRKLLVGHPLVKPEFLKRLVSIVPQVYELIPESMVSTELSHFVRSVVLEPGLYDDANTPVGRSDAFDDDALDQVDIARIEKALGLVDQAGEPDREAIERALGLGDVWPSADRVASHSLRECVQ